MDVLQVSGYPTLTQYLFHQSNGLIGQHALSTVGTPSTLPHPNTSVPAIVLLDIPHVPQIIVIILVEIVIELQPHWFVVSNGQGGQAGHPYCLVRGQGKDLVGPLIDPEFAEHSFPVPAGVFVAHLLDQ